jgi:hypothetical protein
MNHRQTTAFLVVHCSATKPVQDIGRKEINEWHSKQGWDGIGYHFVIRRDGSIETGRHLAAIGSHVKGHNAASVGVCLVGGLDEHGASQNNFTARQFDTLDVLLQSLFLTYPAAQLRGHRDFPGVTKACPCFDVQAWWKERISGRTRTETDQARPAAGEHEPR